ncbi:glycine betaine ABC transporter substrate-binding protein [Streptomyces sp. MBT62]|uniref:glycine betaine ABC transporter substrate-binding protein n=1 Tax=Streptomyces sp. MBT62 TaxID=2800410 RepID=UPI00190A4160|nr:glycine betaine ABC transporter substrate-binding protein [Streptomyces sp. MBT62]MBK3568326.1 ABC transporter substrate-binding protein [Streptomyces sp. MBT62]
MSRTAALAVCSLLLLTGCATANAQGTHVGYADRAGPTVIGTDGSTESRVVAALYGELLTGAGQKVRTADASYASPVATAQAVVDGRISIAPAYESTLLRAMPGGQTMPGNMEATLSMALPPGIVALPPAAAQGGVVLAVTRSTAKRHRLYGLADLRGAGTGLTLGGSASGDPDAPSVATLKTAYGVTLTPAGTAGTADVRVLRSTDPAIARDGLVVLADPKAVVPPEHVFPLISAPALDLTGRTALARVNTQLTTAQLAKLTASVDAGETPGRAARAWLRAKGLLH